MSNSAAAAAGCATAQAVALAMADMKAVSFAPCDEA